MVQVSWLQWVFLLTGGVASGVVLLISLLPAIRNGGKELVVPLSAAVIALHILLAVGFLVSLK